MTDFLNHFCVAFAFSGVLLLGCVAGCGGDAEKSADVCDNDVLVPSDEAEKEVLRVLELNGIKAGCDPRRKSQVVVRNACCRMAEQPKDPLFAIRKLMLIENAWLDCAADVVRMQCEFVDGKEHRAGSTRIETFGTAAEQSARGFSVLNFAEARQSSGAYEVALALASSKKLTIAANSVLTGDVSGEFSKGLLSLEEWLANRDLSSCAGGYQMLDKDGVRHFMGIASWPCDPDADRDSVARVRARHVASGFLMSMLVGDCSEKSEVSVVSQDVGEDESVNENLRTHATYVSETSSVQIRFVKDDIFKDSRGVPVHVSVVEAVAKAHTAGFDCDEAVGRASFAWKKGGSDFAGKRERAYRRAYVDAMSTLALRHNNARRFSIESVLSDGDRVREPVGDDAHAGLQSRFHVDVPDDAWALRSDSRMQGGDLNLPCQRRSKIRGEEFARKVQFPVVRTMASELYDAKTGSFEVILAIDCGHRRNQKAGRKSLEDWLKEDVMGNRTGPCRFVDADGVNWLVGVGVVACEKGETPDAKRLRLCRTRAESALRIAAGGLVSVSVRSFVEGVQNDQGSLAVRDEFGLDCSVLPSDDMAGHLDVSERNVLGCPIVHQLSKERLWVTAVAVKAPLRE